MRINSSGISTFSTTPTKALTQTGGTLRTGSSGAEVKALQQTLARAGFDPGPLDGAFGAKTERAVKAFQRANGLEADGVVGKLTRAALAGGVVAPPIKPPPTTTTARTRTATIGSTPTYTVSGKAGVAFKAGMAIDADGSPHAYNPQNTGLDALGNAGKPGNWWGIDTNSSGKPYVQGAKDPAPGYYVSTTALTDSRYPSSDPRHFVDSETVPFIAVPPELKNQGVKVGDLVAVRNEKTGKTAYAVVADIGPRGKIGEGSIKLAQELGINSNARSGGASSGISYVVFPGTKQAWPMTNAQIQSAGQRLYDTFGGEAQLKSAVR